MFGDGEGDVLSAALDDDDCDGFGDDDGARDDTVAEEQWSSGCRLVVRLSPPSGHGCAARAVFSRCVAGREADRGRAWQ
jgi:hypothetical protein